MGKVVNETSAPQLGSVWFSSTYWRIAAVSALLTLPFLFAAAVQALVRSDLSLLARAAFGHLPIALVGVGIAAPVTMLLLSGTDELCSLVWSPSSSNGLTSLFAGGGTVIGAVALAGSPFLAFLMCLFTAAAAILVWLELAMREAAVYIVVLLLPLAFAALVWPARRVWAVRVVEILVALILSKFAIVAVLGLGGAALDQAGAHGLSAMLAGMVLVLLAALAPWAVLRLVPLAEVASSAASALRPHTLSALQTAWPSARTRERAEQGIAHVTGDIGDLVRLSNNGHSASPHTASSNGYSRNGGAKADGQPYNWEDDALQSAAQPQPSVEDETGEGRRPCERSRRCGTRHRFRRRGPRQRRGWRGSRRPHRPLGPGRHGRPSRCGQRGRVRQRARVRRERGRVRQRGRRRANSRRRPALAGAGYVVGSSAARNGPGLAAGPALACPGSCRRPARGIAPTVGHGVKDANWPEPPRLAPARRRVRAPSRPRGLNGRVPSSQIRCPRRRIAEDHCDGAVSETRLTYTFGPIERRGLLGPVRIGQAALVAVGAVLAIAALDAAPTGTGAVVAVLLVGGAVAAAVLPLGSRTVDEWVPVGCAFALRLATGRARYRSPLPAAGVRALVPRARSRIRVGGSDPAPPPALRELRIVEATYRNRPIGIVSEHGGRRLTAVLACRALAFALLDPEAQERRLARWGLVLSGAASTPIRRLQWVERTVPAQGDELARWLHDERDPAIPLRGTPMIESYLELIGATARVAQEHELLLAVQVDAKRIRGREADQFSEVLIEQAERVAVGLQAAEVTVIGALNPNQLARALRTAFDPFARAELAALEAADPDRRWPVRGGRVATRRARNVGSLPERRRRPCHLLDRRLAPG